METENKLSANRKVAAAAFLSVSRTYNLPVGDISDLGLGKRSSKTRAKTDMAKGDPSKKNDKRLKVAYKRKNTRSLEKLHAVDAHPIG